MKTNEQLLLKHFALVLRNLSNDKQDPISPTLLKYLSRKDLIEVIKKKHDGNLPKELDLALMENEELLQIIKDEMYVIAFVTEKWNKNQTQKLVPDEKGRLMQKMDAVITKTVEKEKKDKKVSSVKDNTKK